MKFLFRTDVHASEHTPASWKGDYFAEILDSLQQIQDLAKEQAVTAILDGGDFFHVKSATRNSHSLIQRVIALHRSSACPVYAIEGNHDLAYNHLDSVSRQPIGVMFAAGIFNRLRDTVFEEDGLRVRVVGVPYQTEPKLDDFRRIRKEPGDDFLIVIAHCLATKVASASTEELFGEPIFQYDDLAFEGGPDVFCFGHWHKDQGAIQVDGVHFVNQGAVSRGSLTHENMKRCPQVAILDVTKTGIQVRLHQLRVAPAEEVYDLAAKVRAEEERGAIAEFVTKLQVVAQESPGLVVESTLKGLDFASDVRDIALDYLEKARAG